MSATPHSDKTPSAAAASVMGEKGPLSGAERAALPLIEATPAICLVNPQMGENIGGAARAMANFGFDQMVLVAPRQPWPNRKAQDLASGADWVLEQARLVETAAEGTAPHTLVVATTGTPRDLVTPLVGPGEAVARLRAAMAAGERPVVLFGAERSGLDNDLILGADLLVTYPVDARHPSLNLAASVAVFCYAWAAAREAAGPPPGWVEREHQPAPRAAFDSLLKTLIDELDASRFFWPDNRRQTMADTLRAALLRGRFSMAETSLLHGALRSLVEGPRRRARDTDARETEMCARAWLAEAALAPPAPGFPDLRGAVLTSLVVGADSAAAEVMLQGAARVVFVTLTRHGVTGARLV